MDMNSERRSNTFSCKDWKPQRPERLITVVSDPHHFIKAEPDALVFTEIEDYVRGYEYLLNAIEKQQKLIVFLQNPTLTVWLSNMAARYPQQTFGFEEMDARTYLGQVWEITIPDYVTDADILQSGLLGSRIIPRAGDTFENVILEYFYAPVFMAAAFSSALLEEIVLAYNQARWEANAANALVLRIYRQRLQAWRDRTTDRAMRTVLDMIKD